MLKKVNRLTKRGSFGYVYNRGERVSAQPLRLVFVKSRAGVKIGFSVSTKIGKAHIRNKVKRRLRAIVRPLIGGIKPCQAVFVAKDGIDNLTFAQLNVIVLNLLSRAKLYEKAS